MTPEQYKQREALLARLQGTYNKQTTPAQNLRYVETVLNDVRAVLKKMHEDKEGVSFEQRGRLWGCLDEIHFALLTIQDDEIGLKGKVERLMAIEQRVEPPLARPNWTRYRGSLLRCLEKAADTYYYSTEEDQGNIDWRIEARTLKQGPGPFRAYELLERIAQTPEQADLPAILDYDTSWFGYSLHQDDKPDDPLWVHAHLYIIGDNNPAALIYRIDFEEEEESES